MSGDDEHNPMLDKKGICLLVFFMDTVIFGLIPYFIIKKAKTVSQKGFTQNLLSYGNCFGGGVFLGACILHLWVEGRENLNEYFEHVSRTHENNTFNNRFVKSNVSDDLMFAP